MNQARNRPELLTIYKESPMRSTVSLPSVIAAEKVISPFLKPTPLTHYQSLSELVGAEVYIKHENHQPGGSFKIRGGLNVMHHLKAQNISSVITYSTGNHGMSIAASAKQFGIHAVIVVPKGSNPLKIARIKSFGALVLEEGDTFEEAAAFGRSYQEKNNLHFVHPANEPHIINGVGTEFIEILRDLPDVDAVMLPIGAGSELAAGVTVLKQVNPKIEIYAVQAQASQAAFLSWQEGKMISSANTTFAGGVATGDAYELTFDIYKNALSDFVLLSEDELLHGVYMAMEHTRNLAEAAGASTIMAALKIKEQLRGKKVVLQMSGANESLDVVAQALKNNG